MFRVTKDPVMLNVIPRSEWGACRPNGSRNRPMPYASFVLHHTAGVHLPATATPARERAVMRCLERTGFQRFGPAQGISYTYVVFASGRVYAGHSPHRQGAHTRGMNRTHAAIALVGNYTAKRPTQAQEVAIARLLVREYRAGRSRQARITHGHRDAPGAWTTCPGNAGMSRIGSINVLAADLLCSGTLTPPNPPTEWEKLMSDLTPAEREQLQAFAKELIAQNTNARSFVRQLLVFHRTERPLLQNMLKAVEELNSSVRGSISAAIILWREAQERGWSLDRERFKENKDFRP